MDDLATKLQELLSTQEGQDNVKRVIEMLGADNGKGPDLSSIANLLNNKPSQEEKKEESQDSSGFDISALTKLLNNQKSGKENSSSPDLTSMLSSLTSALNNNTSSEGPDLSSLAGLLGNMQNSSSSNEENKSSSILDGLGGLDINMLMKIQQLLSSTPKNDKNTALIRALKPHLKKERQGRADEAIRMMQLLQMLPLLKESGLFGGD